MEFEIFIILLRNKLKTLKYYFEKIQIYDSKNLQTKVANFDIHRRILQIFILN